jgi:hypothetical protein
MFRLEIFSLMDIYFLLCFIISHLNFFIFDKTKTDKSKI